MILITTQTFPPAVGGMENLMRGLADAFAQSGESVRVFADAKGDAAEKIVDAECAFVVDRFGGPRILRRIRKARIIARESQNAKAVVADSWKSLERLNLTHRPPIICLAHGSELPDDSAKKEFESIIKDHHPILATVARLEPRKGLDTVIRALPNLINIYPKILYLIGGGEDKKRLQLLANEMGIAAKNRAAEFSWDIIARRHLDNSIAR